MRAVVALSLLVLYALYWFRPYVPRLAYEANKEYIAKNLCENRNRPEMHCEGKCHLRKQIDLFEVSPLENMAPLKKDAKTTDNKNKKKTIEVEYRLLFQALNTESPKLALWVARTMGYSFLFVSRIFHPPRRVANRSH